MTANAHPAGSATANGSRRRIVLRQSAVLRIAVSVFVLVASTAVFTSVLARAGMFQAVLPSVTVFMLLALCAVRYERKQPRIIETGPDGWWVRDTTGQPAAHGRIAGCAQWSDWLLILVLVTGTGRRRPLLVVADALAADAFRELAVAGRRGSQA
jgi:hypothetical protein